MRLKAVCHGSVKRAGGSREGPDGIRRAAGPRVRPCRTTGGGGLQEELALAPVSALPCDGGGGLQEELALAPVSPLPCDGGRRLSMGPGGIPDPRYSGRVMMKTVCSGVDSQEIWPPCATTISLAMARPSPAPPRLVARAASSR